MLHLDNNDSVDASLSNQKFIGNIIDHKWYSQILADSGKPDMVAITLLAELFYQYRFSKAIKLSYKYFIDKFGLSRNQIRDAFSRLESQMLLTVKQYRPLNSYAVFLNITLNIAKVASISSFNKAEALEDIKITGNLIPHAWYKSIITEAGKPDLNAIMILGEAVYQYRPVSYDGETEQSKLKNDLWQVSYQYLSDKFFMSKNQVYDAIKRLEQKILVKRSFGDMELFNAKISNAMFLKINKSKVLELSFLDNKLLKFPTPP